MKAAVIIPVFNEGQPVLAVADAVLESFGDKEVIVANDGFTDDRSQLLGGHNYLTVLTHEKNKGKGETLDIGVRFARDEATMRLCF